MKLKTSTSLLPWLDVLGIATWSILLLKYWVSGKLGLLIHPDYFWLAILTALALLVVSSLKAWLILRQPRKLPRQQHLTLLPPGLSAALLLITALLGLLFTPQVFASQTAMQRGVADSVALTRAQPQAFHSSKPPEERSLIEWVRTLDVYPEPDAYVGQKVNVQGFVILPNNLPSEYITIARFVITCCAADAYPVGLPVKLPQNHPSYAADTWLEVHGEMISETLAGKRQVAIQASSLKSIPEPKNPYDY